MNFDCIMFIVQATRAYPVKNFQIQFQFTRSFLVSWTISVYPGKLCAIMKRCNFQFRVNKFTIKVSNRIGCQYREY
jgi:hypothetical protein